METLMMKKNALEELKNIHTELTYHKGLNALFLWDQWMGLPQEGFAFRQKLQEYLTGKMIDLIQSADAKRLAEYFSDVPLEEIENMVDRAIVRNFLHRYQHSVTVPVELTKKIGLLTSEAQGVWVKAKNEKNYQLFKPYLKEIFELQIEIAGYIDPDRPAFEVMMDANDEGISLSEVHREFDKLKIAVAELTKKIQQSNVSIDDTFLKADFNKDELFEFVKTITQAMGYDPNRGGYGQAVHPFTNMFGPKDSRITVNCSYYKLGVFGAIHEAGHAMYGYRGNQEINAAHLWGGIQGGFHEGQARFYENIIGKSYPFWETFYPKAQKQFNLLESVSLEDYYRAINIVKPSTNRIVSDEVTYSLHPIIRFELEQELINGEVDFDLLPQAWNDKYDRYLGVRPEDDGEGLLQDIHWSAGAIGYFQSYTLGNVYGGQIRAMLLRDIPTTFDEIKKGNFEPLNGWLTEAIHQYGSCFTAPEMIRKISGEGLNADYFIAYLNEKYSKIYSLSAGSALS
jgi:carboxypeptidase Taq